MFFIVIYNKYKKTNIVGNVYYILVQYKIVINNY